MVPAVLQQHANPRPNQLDRHALQSFERQGGTTRYHGRLHQRTFGTDEPERRVRATGGTFLVNRGTVLLFGDAKGDESVEPDTESLSGHKFGVVFESGSEEGREGVEGVVAGVSCVLSAGARGCRWSEAVYSEWLPVRERWGCMIGMEEEEDTRTITLCSSISCIHNTIRSDP